MNVDDSFVCLIQQPSRTSKKTLDKPSYFIASTNSLILKLSQVSLERTEPYKGYWVSSFALLTYSYGNEWYARGSISRVEPSGRTVYIKRFEPSEIFTSKDKAEAHGIALARAWVDERN